MKIRNFQKLIVKILKNNKNYFKLMKNKQYLIILWLMISVLMNNKQYKKKFKTLI